MKQAKRVAVSSNDFGAVLEIINAHRAKAMVSVNVEHLLTNWEIGQIVQLATGQLADCRVVRPSAGQIAGLESVQPAAAQSELKARSFRPADMGQLEFYLEALDRDVKRANENPSVGVLLCKNADRSTVEYALSRSMSPAMVAEYKRLMIPKEVLQETFNRYIGVGN